MLGSTLGLIMLNLVIDMTDGFPVGCLQLRRLKKLGAPF